MNSILTKTFFFSLLLWSLPSQSFFILNKSPYTVLVELWRPMVGDKQCVPEEIVLNAGTMTVINPKNNPNYPSFSQYGFQLLYFNNYAPIYETPVYRIPDDAMFLILSRSSFNIKMFEASSELQKVADINANKFSLAAPFEWSSARAREFFGLQARKNAHKN